MTGESEVLVLACGSHFIPAVDGGHERVPRHAHHIRQLLERVSPRQTVVTGASPEAFEFSRIWGIYSTLSVDELENYTSAGALALAFDIPIEVVPTDV